MVQTNESLQVVEDYGLSILLNAYDCDNYVVFLEDLLVILFEWLKRLREYS